jgi:hypothetical protein
MSVFYLQDMVRRTPLPLSQAKKRALRRHRLVACRQTLLDLAEEQARLYGASQCWFGPPSDVDFLHASKREIDFAPLPQDNIYRTASLNNNKHIDSHSLIDVDISHNAVASESSRPVHNAVAAVASESSHNAVASESSQNAVASESSRPVQNAVASESSHHAVASESPHNAVSQVVSTSKVTCASSHDVIPSSSSKEASMSKVAATGAPDPAFAHSDFDPQAMRMNKYCFVRSTVTDRHVIDAAWQQWERGVDPYERASNAPGSELVVHCEPHTFDELQMLQGLLNRGYSHAELSYFEGCLIARGWEEELGVNSDACIDLLPRGCGGRWKNCCKNRVTMWHALQCNKVWDGAFHDEELMNDFLESVVARLRRVGPRIWEDQS